MTPALRLRRRLRLALWLTLAAGAVVAAIAWFARPPESEGIVVRVRVTDPEGRPVPGAEVQRVFAPGWARADPQGLARLERVVLRAGEAPSAAAVVRAVGVRAPGHAPRARSHPRATEREDGTWDCHVVAEPCGLIRLRVRQSHLPAVRAVLEAQPAGSVEAIGGVEVARPGQPAEFRAFGEARRVTARLRGATGVAARTRLVVPPSPGHVREVLLVAEKAVPIRGRVLPPSGVVPPTLEGRVEITERLEAGGEFAESPVRIDADGTFEIPYAGPGRYRLVAHIPYLDVPAHDAEGGDELIIDDARALPWLVLELPGEESDLPHTYLRVSDAGTGQPVSPDRTGAEVKRVPLPATGRYRVVLNRAGGRGRLPARGEIETEVTEVGPHVVRVPMAEQPAGEVVVQVQVPNAGGGAHIRMLVPPRPKPRTLLFDLGDVARFENVRAGPVELRVAWTASEVPSAILRGMLDANGVLELRAVVRRGGRLVLEGSGPGLDGDLRPRLFTWDADGAKGRLHLNRLPGTREWRGAETLAPGKYEGRIRLGSQPEAPGTPLTFEIRSGETTVLPLRVEAEE